VSGKQPSKVAAEQEEAQASPYASTTGQVFTGSAWLDLHFEACRREYEAMLRLVPIEPGWRVLDAGCGSGSYLPLLADLVGPTGSIDALDLAEDNVVAVRERLVDWHIGCPVEVRRGGVTALPYSNETFDAVWCANTLQYLSADDWRAALAEFRRVVRPGGIVGIKDVDMQLVRLYPVDQFLVAHLSEASLRGDGVAVESRGSLRGRELRRWLERAGMVDVWQRTMLIERWAPLQPVERRFWGDWLASLGRIAAQRGVPAADLSVWQALQDPGSPDNVLNQPDFYGCEGQVVAVGRVPLGAEAAGRLPLRSSV